MSWEVDESRLAKDRLTAFQSSSMDISKKVFSFPELLIPPHFSTASPTPTQAIDLVPTLSFTEDKADQILAGLTEIKTVQGFGQGLQWLVSEEIILSKALNRDFYQAISGFATAVNNRLFMYLTPLENEPAEQWAETLRVVRRFQFQFGLPGFALRYLRDLIGLKREEEGFWLLMIELSHHFPQDIYVKEVIGRDWLNNYYLHLKALLEAASEQVFLDKEKLFAADTTDAAIQQGSLQENQESLLRKYQELSIIFGEFDLIRKHPIYVGIIGRLSFAFDRLTAVCELLKSEAKN